MPRSQRLTRQKPRMEVRRTNQPTVMRKNESHSVVASANIRLACSSVRIPGIVVVVLLGISDPSGAGVMVGSGGEERVVAQGTLFIGVF